MKLKNLSRLTALLLAFIICFSSVAQAETTGYPLSDLTDSLLDALAGIVLPQEEAKGYYGIPMTLEYSPSEDLSGYTFQWYVYKRIFGMSVNNTEADAPNQLTITPSDETTEYYCVATDANGNKTRSNRFGVVAYTADEAAEYLKFLSMVRASFPGDNVSYRAAAYTYLTETWNVTLSGDTQNLAQAILTASATSTAYPSLLCTCCIDENGAVSSDILWAHDAAHKSGCPWEVYTVTLPIPEQPPFYGETPNGAQYENNSTHKLPMTQAIILPANDSATVVVGVSGVSAYSRGGSYQYQWQVYNGSEWANMLGEYSSTLIVTTAKLQTIFDLTGVAHLRYYDRMNDVVLGYVDVTSQENANGEYPEEENTEDTQNLLLTSRETVTSTTYPVTIDYVLEGTTTSVGQSYSAWIAEGTGLDTVITLPAVPGYKPAIVTGEVEGKATCTVTAKKNTETKLWEGTAALLVKDIDRSIELKIEYVPVEVEYTVVYHQQNVADDNYTEVKRETLTALTNTPMPAVDVSYSGFYQLKYEQPAIAADGSTLVGIYYDRYYYLMNFDLDGGYGVEPIYARFGAPIGDVGTPEKAGYTFKGWSLDGTNTVALPGEMPAENRTYKAVWQADDTAKVTVVFWGENADDEKYSYVDSAEVYLKPGTEFTYSLSNMLVCVVEEHTHKNDCYDRSSLICTQEVHEHNGDCNYTCGETEHTTHTTACYAGVGNRYTLYNAPRYPSEGQVYQRNNNKYIYINGSWYNYTGTTTSGNIAPTTCHKHSDACYNHPEHTHSIENGCYELICPEIEHSHTSACYMNGAGLDSNLWTFVKSDTVTVAADGSTVVNVYYDRTEFTFTFQASSNTIHTFTAKWGADISDKWSFTGSNGITYPQSNTSWTPTNSSTYTQRITMMVIMPAENITFRHTTSNNTSRTFHYYVESLTGVTGSNTRTYDGIVFEWKFDLVNDFNYLYYEEDFFKLEGFTRYKSAREDGREYPIGNGTSPVDNLYFYYTRNRYDLVMNNGEKIQYIFTSDEENEHYATRTGEGVLFEAPLKTYEKYVPTAPSWFEEGTVAFAGWYLNPECSGEEYKLDVHTMPIGGVLLYAKWVPVTHKVEFYLSKTEYEAGTKLSTHPDITVPHGSKANPTPADPTNGSYTFVGWFYMENGVEKAFDFANMPVNKDLKVYGKWSSNVLKEYKIYYKTKVTNTETGEVEEIEIAAPTSGQALAGVEKTFDAKGGTDLYKAYQEGFFPETPSHTLIIDIDGTNEYTFWYVQKEAVPYEVYYLAETVEKPEDYQTIEKDGKSYYIVHATKTVSDNRSAVVTETFVVVQGMMPDAYQKRLVVSAADGAVNEIIFYYTIDTTHAYYKITHYTQALDGNWVVYAETQAQGDIGTTYTAEPMRIPGFTYDSSVQGTLTSGKLTSAGLDLKLYYTRNSYPYQVRYLEQGTGKQLADPKTDGTGKYGEVISESAIDIANYTPVDPTSQTLNIRIEEDSVAKLNIITFYYTENEATINYVVVGPDGCGSVTPTSETLKVLTGTAQGSTATANENFKFVGWYRDAACTEANKLSTEAKYEPTKTEGTAWVDVTYYAKFEYNLTSLTITKEGLTQTSGDDRESAIITVTDSSGNLVARFALQNNSVTIDGLTVGATYTITEENGWTWRYDKAEAVKCTIQAPPATNSVTITNSNPNPYWLGGDNYKVNTFGTGTN